MDWFPVSFRNKLKPRPKYVLFEKAAPLSRVPLYVPYMSLTLPSKLQYAVNDGGAAVDDVVDEGTTTNIHSYTPMTTCDQ